MILIKKLLFNLIKTEIMNVRLDENIIKSVTDNDWKQIYQLAKRHDIAHLVGNEVIKQQYVNNSFIKDKFSNEVFVSIYRYENINAELDNVRDVFNNAKIPFIPLKGSVMRNYYPEPWMRTSCDIDILVQRCDVEKATAAIIDNLNYTIHFSGQYEISLFSPSKVHLELHFNLVEENFKEIKDLQDIWVENNVQLLCGHEYQMSNELFLLYHIYHMAKHFVHGGCGIKPFIDLWVIQNKIGYDEEKAEELLKESDLLLFYNHAMELMNVWFEEKPHNSVTQEMENYVLQGGVYGTLEQQLAMSQNKKGGKFRHLLSKIFLSYEQMKVYYPSVKKCPILFPLYQVRRWCRILFCGGRKTAMNEIKVNQNLSEEKKQSAKRLIDELGL